MMISPNTQAILLLTAPLIAGKNQPSTDILSPGEYKKLARFLRDNQRQPSDFLGPEAKALIEKCSAVFDGARIERLLGRGFLLSQAVERWQARTIWVMSRADAEYPGNRKPGSKTMHPRSSMVAGKRSYWRPAGWRLSDLEMSTVNLQHIPKVSASWQQVRRKRLFREARVESIRPQ